MSDGKLNGICLVVYDKNFELTNNEDSIYYYRKLIMKNGKPNGMAYDYFKNGKIQGEGFLINEKPEVYSGIYKSYFMSGKINSEGESDSEGYGLGKHKVYYENGTIEYIEEYENRVIKHFKSFDEKGNLIAEGKLKNNAYYNGWLYDYTEYKNGVKELDGDFMIIENPKDASNNENGPVNERKYYDEKGNVLKTEKYETSKPWSLLK